MQLIAIGLGGAIGSLARFWLATGVYAWLGRDFPWGTLLVNLLGSFLIGFLAFFLADRALAVEWRAAIFMGFLGAFTTFSTFSLETIALLQIGEVTRAFLNIIVSVFCCLLATWLGMILAKQF
ncbi:camphor resistance protein CrcB [Thioflexithrix psekupsensis]|uniref:Fluoride-specific ion channel FluC n=1 Tax=Thioflexithrix psekupsensis TaxID=1570016 RepID=A0A251XAT3_9GAMM|nr:camphor resistance protein CrcB [Thioflexithrix psekupsensis]